MGYMYVIGSLLLITGEKWAALILFVPHFCLAVLSNAPASGNASTSKYGFQMQAMGLDCVILMALLMITGMHLSISTPGKAAKDFEKKKKEKQAKWVISVNIKDSFYHIVVVCLWVWLPAHCVGTWCAASTHPKHHTTIIKSKAHSLQLTIRLLACESSSRNHLRLTCKPLDTGNHRLLLLNGLCICIRNSDRRVWIECDVLVSAWDLHTLNNLFQVYIKVLEVIERKSALFSNRGQQGLTTLFNLETAHLSHLSRSFKRLYWLQLNGLDAIGLFAWMRDHDVVKNLIHLLN